MNKETGQEQVDAVIIYHKADLDGLASGAVIAQHCEDQGDKYLLIGYDYGEPLPEILKSESKIAHNIYVADVWLGSVETMLRLTKKCYGQVYWLDHHSTQYDAFVNNEFARNNSVVSSFKKTGGFVEYSIEARKIAFAYADFNYIYMDGVGACEICYRYLNPGKKVPKHIWLLSNYDTWQKNLPNWEWEILPFQYAMRLVADNSVDKLLEFFQLKLDENNKMNVDPKAVIEQLMNSGFSIIQYQKSQDQKNAKNFAYETEFMGLPAIALNSPRFNSMAFDSVYDPEKHKLMICYNRNGEDTKVCLYSTHDDIHCGELAKEFGGGGHKGAAGFQTPDLHLTLFMLNE